MIASRPLRARLWFVPAIVGAWLLLALAWTPATLLVERAGGHGADGGGVFLLVLLSFVPWMAATPLMLWLAQRFPVAQRRVERLLVHAMVGVIVIPLVALAGRALTLLVNPVGSWSHFGIAVAITAFYSVPIYVAVAAIGQALARAHPLAAATQTYPARLAIREKGRTDVLETRAIDHVDVAGHYLCIHAGEAVHVIRGQLGDLEARLDPAEFARVHRSTIVRLDRIRALDERRNGDCELLLASGRRVAASRSYRDALQARLGMAQFESPS
ncbi:LytTR family transcriptional regulator [Sphingomonas sp. LB-2]|uniref:LytTR family DNA-binding domain-containing protein n=1 Tax=Sphingomonas caeni TaxID=2984949 RepID=UPI002230FE46|nr:LytTR family DNA-binding domain-containing protein [Sphingomonas caeni]MCW3847499.1 LytTR family transcriptional regulator [Sphingomonas caeni]